MSKAEYARRYEYLETEIRRAIEDRFNELKRPSEQKGKEGLNVLYFKNSQPAMKINVEDNYIDYNDVDGLVEENGEIYATDRYLIDRYSIDDLVIWHLAYIADEINEMGEYDAEQAFDAYEHEEEWDDEDDE